VASARRPAAGHDRHAGPVGGSAAHRRVDHAGVGGDSADDQGRVPAVDGAGGKLADQRLVGQRGPGHDQQARRALVQPVDDARAGRTARAGQVGEAAEQSLDQGAGRPPGARVHDQPGRLVNHDHVVVDVDQRQRGPRPGLADEGLGAGAGRQHDLQVLATDHPAGPGRGRPAAEAHRARRDQLGGLGTGQVPDQAQDAIEALAVQGRRDRQPYGRHGGRGHRPTLPRGRRRPVTGPSLFEGWVQ
jgi:hypothetical protein